MRNIVGPAVGRDENEGNLYSDARRRYKHVNARPQAMVWANNEGYVGTSGYDTGTAYPFGAEGEDFIITSDHNRSSISIDKMRIENKQRMVNGNMRSYWTDDKVTINCSWNLLPSRAYQKEQVVLSADPPISRFSQAPYQQFPPNSEYTADGGAGAVDMLTWYNETHGPFWVFLSYDNFSAYETNPDKWEQFARYGDRYHVFFNSFNYSIEKRGLYDMWNVSVTLEEV